MYIVYVFPPVIYIICTCNMLETAPVQGLLACLATPWQCFYNVRVHVYVCVDSQVPSWLSSMPSRSCWQRGQALWWYSWTPIQPGAPGMELGLMPLHYSRRSTVGESAVVLKKQYMYLWISYYSAEHNTTGLLYLTAAFETGFARRIFVKSEEDPPSVPPVSTFLYIHSMYIHHNSHGHISQHHTPCVQGHVHVKYLSHYFLHVF